MASSSCSRLGTIVRRSSCSIIGRRKHSPPSSSLLIQCRRQSAILNRRPPHHHHYDSASTQIRSILLFGDNGQQFDKRRPWHNPNFMKDDPPDQVEAWLISLLKSVSNDIHTEYSPNNPPVSFDGNKFMLDSRIYLRVLEAYARAAKHYSGAPQKAEYWVNHSIRHYENARSLFESKYRIKFGSELMQSNQTQQSAAAAIVHGLQPDVEFYNSVIECWANSKEQISIPRSATWLSKLEADCSTNNPLLLQPNARSYDLYLNSVSRGIGKNSKVHLERAEEAERILQYRLSSDAPTSIRPTTESYNYVLRAYTRCRKERSIAGKVMTLVREMEQIQKEAVMNGGHDVDNWKINVVPNTKTYTMAMDAWIIKAGIKSAAWRSEKIARNNKLKQKGLMQQSESDDGSSSTSKDDDDDGTKELEFAKSILQYITALEAVGQADVRASVVGYNTLLTGYARLANELRPDIPLIAEQLLNEMIDASEDRNTYPDVTSFNAVIKAWGKAKKLNSAARCEYWLHKMINENRPREGYTQQTTPIAQPDASTYNLVMDAWMNMDNPDAARVQDLLLEMKASDTVSPNSESYSKVIRAWLKDELLNQLGVQGSSVERAWANLDELMSLEAQGDVGPAPELFTSILKTAARSEGRGENLLAVAQESFWAKRNRSRFNVDQIDFVFLLEIGMKVLVGEERDKFMVDLIRQCSKDGFVSKRFVREAVRGPVHEEWPEEERVRIVQLLFGEEDEAVGFSFPSSWSRNVHKHDQPSAKDLMHVY
ncbi:pentatricopeptide repeat-containing protein [Skeletonema marinoi]|uniref:Pentatricopeptide repeat-containing protein n=1 Tax=Skeletonema marinoi TaxID=267567 RepID=A0AAD8YFR3_9STRA|nr:pentatricopeptide repeat-containing protein [Skeletonema marinoi]